VLHEPGNIRLRKAWFDNNQIVALANNPDVLDLPPADHELIRYTTRLTRSPDSVTQEDIERLRSHGFTDLDILDANSQCAHVNYVNRVSRGLGITHAVDHDSPAYSAIPEDRSTEAPND
jgi:uncharacterized peroxidase-related enzyme